MKGHKLGQYVKGDSVIHNLDPRTKLIYCLFILTSTLLSSNWVIIIIHIFILVLSISFSNIKIFKFIVRIKSLLVILLLTFLFQSILTQGEEILRIGTIIFTKQGVNQGILTAARMIILYLCSTILTMTTSPISLASAMESLLSPLAKLNIPVNQLSMMISISLRFIPTIIQEAENIKCAQWARGARLESGNFFVRMKSILAVLIPVLVTAIQRTNELAAAMESRCYHSQSSFIDSKELYYKRTDFITMGIMSVNLIICFVL
ncbi:MAG: energy-coupling factor transporter transmembrane component T [Clostridiaceae bacterium]